MAITINSQPTSTTKYPAWNDIKYLVNSSSSAQPGFKIVCKVYDSPNGANTLIQQLDLYIVPTTTTKVYVNISNIVQSYITDTYSIVSGATVDTQNQDLLEIGVSFQEYYSGALQGVATDADDLWVFRGSFPKVEWLANDFATYQLNTAAVTNQTDNLLNGWSNDIAVTGTTNPTLTAANNFVKMKSAQQQQIRWMNDSRAATPTLRVYVALYDSNFAVTDSDYVSTGATAEGKMYSLDIGTSQLSAHTWVGTGLTPTSTDKYMAVWVVNNAGAIALSQAKLFELDWSTCYGFTQYELHWLNRYGGFDSYTFIQKSKHDTMVEQTTYKNDAIQISGNAFVDVNYKRTVIPFYTKLKEKYTLNTDILKQWEYEGLRDIITSPEVYVLIDGSFYSCVVTDNRTIRNFRTQEMDQFNLELKIEIDQNELRQW